MLLEAAKPLTFIFCILSLYAVFHSAFLVPASEMPERIYNSLELLALAAAISLMSGLTFTDTWTKERHPETPRLAGTLPVQVFCWASSAMLILFIVSWYVETHCVFYRDVRF